METKTKSLPVPKGYHTVNPYLFITDTSAFIELMKHIFEAKEKSRMTSPEGLVRHAELVIGDTIIMLAESGPEWKATPGSFYAYVKDTDKVYEKAMKAGCVSLMKPADQFYGDRNAGFKDLFGNTWWIATHIEDISAGEMKKREEAWMKSHK
jgi:PhnB protein